ILPRFRARIGRAPVQDGAIMGADLIARGLAASSRRMAGAAGRLPAMLTAHRPLTTSPMGLQVMAAPPAITRTSGGETTVGPAVRFGPTSGRFRYTGTPHVAHATLGGLWRVQSRPGGVESGANWWVIEWYSDAS